MVFLIAVHTKDDKKYEVLQQIKNKLPFEMFLSIFSTKVNSVTLSNVSPKNNGRFFS